MLRKAKSLIGYSLEVLDGEIGKVKDFYFDDNYWTIRYLVVETGSWLTGRTVLISPHALGAVSETERSTGVNLTKKQVEDSPSWDTDVPVSRQFEHSYYAYYGWPYYWSGSYMWGNYPYIMRSAEAVAEKSPDETHWDSHLRSTNTVEGYSIRALDGHIGHVSDFIVSDETWAIRYLVIDARKWWHGKHVLIAPHWADRVSWDDSNIFVNVTKETIKLSPDFDPSLPITSDMEAEIRKYYESYWANTSAVPH